MKKLYFKKGNRHNFLPLIMLLLMLPAVLFSQADGSAFDFRLNTGQFRGPNTLTCLEIYFSISRQSLTFVPWEDNKLKAGFSISLQVFQGDSLVKKLSTNNVTYVESDSELTINRLLFSQTSLYLAPGEYRVAAKMQDMYSDKNNHKEFQQVIRLFSDAELNISDIELAVSLKRDTTKNQFHKNGYIITPNPSSLYGSGLAILYFYAEIYNLKFTGPEDTSKYAVQRRIFDSQGKVVRDFGKQVKRKPGTSAVEIGGVNIITQKSGTYFFNIQVTDLAAKATKETKRKFFVYRQGDFAAMKAQKQQPSKPPATPEIFSDARYSEMTDDEIDEEFESTRYISTKEERKIFKKLDPKGKKPFLIEFWKKRDTLPETKKNEFRDRYLSLVEHANQKFRGFKKGWKTDQGRVLLLYGKPDEVERIPFSSENKPYEIWKYFSIQGGVDFYFVDKRGFGTMELVHSTARGELNDANWSRWTTSGTGY